MEENTETVIEEVAEAMETEALAAAEAEVVAEEATPAESVEETA